MNQYLKLGDLLVAGGLITNLQLSAVLTAQKTSRRRLGDLLVERGLVTEDQITECLAKQYGYPIADVKKVKPQPEAMTLIDPEVALSYCVLPVKIQDESLECIIADPLDIVGTDFISQMVQRRLAIQIAPKAKLVAAIQAAYAKGAAAAEEVNAGVPFPPERFTEARARKRMSGIAAFDAFDTHLNRHVTLSVTKLDTEEERAHYALAKAAARTTAKAVCAVHDSFVHEDHRFIVFEAIDGEPLSHVIASRGPRSLMQAAEMVAELAEGIDALNRVGGKCGLVCPENVLIRWNGPLITPFANPSLAYQAPEGVTGEQVAATDIFALGTILWEAFTGENPHGSMETQMIWADPRKMKGVPTALREIMNNCLGLDPQERYSTAFQLTNALRSYNWASVSLTIAEGGATQVPTSRDREELLHVITLEEEHDRQPFWKKLFGRRKAA
jgi:hypothetical protein